MGLSLAEQELVINITADSKAAMVYTSYPKWIRKFDKLCMINPDEFTCTGVNKCNGVIVSKEYIMPARLVSIRTGVSSKSERSNALHVALEDIDGNQAVNCSGETERGD